MSCLLLVFCQNKDGLLTISKYLSFEINFSWTENQLGLTGNVNWQVFDLNFSEEPEIRIFHRKLIVMRS